MKISTGGEVQVTKILIVRTTKMDDDGGGRDEANDDVSFLHCKELKLSRLLPDCIMSNPFPDLSLAFFVNGK